MSLLLTGTAPPHVTTKGDPLAVPREGQRPGCGEAPKPPANEGKRTRCYWYAENGAQCCDDSYKLVQDDLIYTCERSNCQSVCNGLWAVVGFSCKLSGWVEPTTAP